MAEETTTAPAGAEELAMSKELAQRIRVAMALEVRRFERSAAHWEARGERLAFSQATGNADFAKAAQLRFNKLYPPTEEEKALVEAELFAADRAKEKVVKKEG